MDREKISISDVIKQRQASTQDSTDVPDFEDDLERVNSESYSADDFREIKVDYSKFTVEAEELPAINDEQGRISDIIEALEEETGLSVIPLEMGHIAPEVVCLQRHTIYELGDKRYAMSHKIRTVKMEQLKNQIVRTLSSAIPFELVLNDVISYHGKDYETLKLSQDEWEYTLARFRLYKQDFGITSDNKLVMHIYAERAS